METKETNKKIFYIIILVFIICLAVVVLKQSENKKVETNININTNNEEQVEAEKETEITTVPFDEYTTLEEAEGKIYEEYSNNNLRIVGAVIQEVNSDHIIVKIYRAGEGTSSIVEEKRINITSNTPVFETVISFEESPDADNEPITTKKTTAALKVGDHIVIECAENKSMKDANEFTALIITKDVLVIDEPEENVE